MKSGVCSALCSQRGGVSVPLANIVLMRRAAVAAEVARVAGALGLAARGRVGLLVAVEAAAHPRQLVARRELELLDGAVALRAADVPVDVGLVVEEQVRARQRQRGARVAVAVLVAEVAERALPDRVVARP